MNKIKKYLIIFAIIFSFVDIGWQIYDIVRFFNTASQHRSPVFYVVLNFITIIQALAVAVLLILAIWQNGKLFTKRYGYYMTALVLSIIINLFSISSILLIISMFISDWVWVKPVQQQDDKVVEVKREVIREERIAQLRKKRDNGEITEEEFQEQLLNLL